MSNLPMTKDMAINFLVPFGKYKGLSLGEIFLKDPDYLDWLSEELEWEKYPRLCEALASFALVGQSKGKPFNGFR